MTRVAVVGAGTMGHGIAQVAALAGYDTCMTDVSAIVLERALNEIETNLDGGVRRGKVSHDAARAALERIETQPSLEAAVHEAELVIEAIVEDLDAKRELFLKLDRYSAKTATLATNTSSLSIRRIAAVVSDPGRVVGMHFFNPVHIMKLVEIVTHDSASAEHVEHALGAARAMGKEPILVKDSPGFASSRLGVVLGLEAMRMLEDGVASAEDIDRAMESGYGHPMGPLRVSDLVGLDVRLAIAEYLHGELGSDHYAPPAILREKVRAGELGKKTGKGFYEWPKKK